MRWQFWGPSRVPLLAIYHTQSSPSHPDDGDVKDHGHDDKDTDINNIDLSLHQNGSNNQRNYGNNNGKYDKYYNDKDNHGIVQFRHPRSLLYDLSGSRVIVHWLGTTLGFISGLSR